MRRTAWPLLGLLLSAAPALGQDMCCGARSTRFNFTVDSWPGVRQARYEWRLRRDNPAGMDALMEQERAAYNQTPTVVPQYYLLTGAPFRPSAPATAPADAPPPPAAPAPSTPSDRPPTPRPEATPGR